MFSQIKTHLARLSRRQKVDKIPDCPLPQASPHAERNPVPTLQDVWSVQSRTTLAKSGVLEKMQMPDGGLRPISLICETTNICNCACVFCPYPFQSRARGTMSQPLFEKVLHQYAAMGGGVLSLTPMVGDVLLDRELPRRIQALRAYKGTIIPSVTTNLYALDHHSDEVIADLLETFVRIHVSTYGLTADECKTITRRNHFAQYGPAARRLAELWKKGSGQCVITVGFRLTRDYPLEVLQEFVRAHFGQDFFCSGTHRYANWGNSISGPLPGTAEWIPSRVNQRTCVLLAVALQVYWDGRVSACACCDYDASGDLFVGDLRSQNLREIYDGVLNRQIWHNHESGQLPAICERCTFHIPLTDLHRDHSISKNVIDFLGG